MTTNRSRFSNFTPRQIGVSIALIILLIIIAWQLKSLFSNKAPVKTRTATTTTNIQTQQKTITQGAPNTVAAQQRPIPMPLPKTPPLTQREMELMRMQQETQAKYLAALNELQMLKVQRELAETNRAIAAAKLATVTSQKGIMDILSPPPPPPPPPPAPVPDLRALAPAPAPTAPQPIIPVKQAVNYTVISVSKIRYKWNAVLSYQGSLYNVAVGDVLPPDSSKVIGIDNSGVTLMKDGERKKLSLVPII